MEIKGKLIEKSETANVTATFKKREFVLEYAENPQYPEFIKFELIQDKCDQLDGFNIGQEINVAFNLKGRKWTDPQGVVKYFNSLQAWKLSAAHDITVGTPSNKPSVEPEALSGQSEPEWLQSTSGTDGDDLPF
ncbi:DUF3127 domain-containing protein [Reichenbachiella sp. MALMAid0571]|uniref:DUF3127 domain-containing protein n=1 Tax=Reichenbachiella sp. MALMAid0571 TaxID=3143939 RepID=UPI0032DE880E